MVTSLPLLRLLGSCPYFLGLTGHSEHLEAQPVCLSVSPPFCSPIIILILSSPIYGTSPPSVKFPSQLSLLLHGASLDTPFSSTSPDWKLLPSASRTPLCLLLLEHRGTDLGWSPHRTETSWRAGTSRLLLFSISCDSASIYRVNGREPLQCILGPKGVR